MEKFIFKDFKIFIFLQIIYPEHDLVKVTRPHRISDIALHFHLHRPVKPCQPISLINKDSD